MSSRILIIVSRVEGCFSSGWAYFHVLKPPWQINSLNPKEEVTVTIFCVFHDPLFFFLSCFVTKAILKATRIVFFDCDGIS